MANPTNPYIAFVCAHGAAKSVIAAAYYRSMAEARGQSVRTAAYGVEPDPEVPAAVIDGLRRDGHDPAARTPVAATAEALASAHLVVVMGCELPAGICAGPVVHWEGVPAVSDSYEAARADIVQRVQELLDRGT